MRIFGRPASRPCWCDAFPEESNTRPEVMLDSNILGYALSTI